MNEPKHTGRAGFRARFSNSPHSLFVVRAGLFSRAEVSCLTRTVILGEHLNSPSSRLIRLRAEATTRRGRYICGRGAESEEPPCSRQIGSQLAAFAGVGLEKQLRAAACLYSMDRRAACEQACITIIRTIQGERSRSMWVTGRDNTWASAR